MRNRCLLLSFLLLLAGLFIGCGAGSGGSGSVASVSPTPASGSLEGFVTAGGGAGKQAKASPVKRAEIRLEGTESVTTSDLSGYFVLTGLVPGEYTLKISAQGYPDYRCKIKIRGDAPSFAGNSADEKTLDITTGSVSGKVLYGAGATPLVGARVAADTGSSQLTDSNGEYVIYNLPPGNRSITASFSFQNGDFGATTSVPDTALIEQGVPTTLNFTAGLLKSSISGKLVATDGKPLPGAVLSYSGPVSGAVTVDKSGRWGIEGLSDGSYVITPSHPDYQFNPSYFTVTIVSFHGQSARAFPGPDRHLISGTITAGGSPVAGIAVFVDGPGVADFTTSTDSSGFWSVTTTQNGGYVVTPTSPNYTFNYNGTPGSGQGTGSASITVNNASVPGVDFLATRYRYDIGGTISDSQTGGPLSGVTVNLTGDSTASTTTDANGNYLFQGLANGNYTVTPSLAAYTFNPVNRAVTISSADVTGQNFQGTYTLKKISGRITWSGTGVSGVTVSYTGPTSGSVTTDGNGYYDILNVSDGVYSVTPSHTDYTVSYSGTPGTGQGTGTASITISGATVTGADFSATKIKFTVSGTITNGGSPLSGIAVDLTGDATQSTTTNASGYYQFTSLNNGNYTITPTSVTYNFVPTSCSVTISGGDETCNFVTVVQDSMVFISLRDGNEEIYIMNPNGTGQTRLTSDPDIDSDPALSPDWTQIVFSTKRTTILAANDNPEGDFEICMMDTTGTLLRRLTNNAVDDWCPSFSPDQTKIYWTQGKSTNAEIWVMNNDAGGTSKTNLSNTAGVLDAYPSRANAPDLGKNIIVYQRGEEIYRMDTDGANKTLMVSTVPGTGPFELEEPRISPDGAYVAFRAVDTGAVNNDANLWTYRISNGNLFQVTSNTGWDWKPTWSSASNTLIFTSNRTGLEQIWSILSNKTDTQGGNQLTQYTITGDNWWGGGKRILRR
ncbi:MAG: carboxypeptidase regulatory-like domain-containing protein [Armatimonadetes bacterium]|nr:carboxypeptidase regulatory-like domain-containing protein [Armatimonadota bacterium]